MNWDLVFSSGDCDIIWDNFKNAITTGVSEAIPFVKNRTSLMVSLVLEKLRRHRGQETYLSEN